MKHALRARQKLQSCRNQFPLNCKVKKRPIQNLSVALGRNRPKVSFGVISGECVSWQAFLKNDFFPPNTFLGLICNHDGLAIIQALLPFRLHFEGKHLLCAKCKLCAVVSHVDETDGGEV